MTNQTADSRPALAVAIIDDAFAQPDRLSVETALPDFCAAVEESDASETLMEAIGNTFLDAGLVDDDAVAAMFAQRDKFPDLAREVSLLFAQFTDRRNDLDKIRQGIKGFKGAFLHDFGSIEKFKKTTTTFDVVFLDYRLKGVDESAQIAREVYTKHRAFIVLMSDQPDTADRESEFRKQVRLLQGFFKYVPKHELVEPENVYRTMTFVPENPKVCIAIHDLIDSLDWALGGQIEEIEKSEIKDPPAAGQAIGRFMNVVRSLPLQDYALLCELTLADEGHPLGDYIRRLFGAHLVKQVFRSKDVAQTLKDLDSLRFTEFLPLATTPSDSLKELYASSLVEPITNPWGEHPWENEAIEGDVDAGA